jgi:VIT1/CCC1 family predicted Fe2+/Mn2+ transporter
MYGSLPDPRPAFQSKDANISRQIHEKRAALFSRQGGTSPTPERHVMGGEALKSAVYGAVDGVLTSFAILSGAAGGNLSPSSVLVLGISALVADAVSMGICDAVSTASFREHVAAERKREEWEFDSFPEGEIEEMVDLYESRGLPRDKAERCIGIMAKYRNLFIDVMVVEELGLQIEKDALPPWKLGIITCLSFFVTGIIPVFVYAMSVHMQVNSNGLLHIASGVTLMILFMLGVLKSQFSIAVWWRSGLEFMILGGMVSLTAYFIGSVVKNMTGETGDLMNSSNNLLL